MSDLSNQVCIIYKDCASSFKLLGCLTQLLISKKKYFLIEYIQI